MDMSHDIVEKSILLPFNISKWLGLFPFRINIDGYFKLSVQHCIIFFIVLIFVIINNYVITSYYNVVIVRSNSSLFSYTYKITSWCLGLYPFMSVTELFFRLKELNEAIAKLRRVCNIAFPSCCPMKYKVLNVYLHAITAYIALMNIYDAWLYKSVLFNSKIFIVFALITVLELFLLTVLIDRFSFIVSVITSLFRLCNNDLSSLPISTPTRNITRLERLTWAHDQLCDCATMISDAHGFQILFIIELSISAIVVSTFSIVQRLISGLWNVFLIVSFMCWFYIYCRIPWSIVDSSDKCRSEAKKFNTLLYQLMIDDKTNEISENKKLRLHISMKREVVFSACGFFNLDYTLIHSMVAAATTYLVILIQFGQPMNNEVPPEHLNATLTTSSEVSNFFTTPSWIYTTI
ncbi:Gustatory receptor 81i [Halyomorpha halys]|nr:Gustatory receptor 81i [Halyomorpha halys]